MLRIAQLLIHSDDVPPAARAALSTALEASPGSETDRCDSLVEAARILHREVGLDCADARELVGLSGLDAALCD